MRRCPRLGSRRPPCTGDDDNDDAGEEPGTARGNKIKCPGWTYSALRAHIEKFDVSDGKVSAASREAT
jgi:hypothetical protein